MEQMELMPTFDADALMLLKQAPVIEEHLQSLADTIDDRVRDALNRAATAGTLKEIKDLRAELGKEFRTADKARIAFKKAYDAPYEKMLETYKAVTRAYTDADRLLKGKVDTMTAEIIDTCVAVLESHFIELRQLYKLDWLSWDQLGIKPSLTEAQQKTRKKLLERVSHDMGCISEDVIAISTMDDSAEVMVEYKKTLNLPRAIQEVKDRKERVQREAEAAEMARKQFEAEMARQAEIRSASVLDAPKPLEAPTVHAEPEPVYTVRFEAKLTKGQGKALKAWFAEQGVEWRSIT